MENHEEKASLKDTLHGLASETRRLTARKPTAKPSDQFHDGTKWTIPENCFIVCTLPGKDVQKIDRWQRKKHELQIVTSAAGELFIINESLLREWHAQNEAKAASRKVAEIERTAP